MSCPAPSQATGAASASSVSTALVILSFSVLDLFSQPPVAICPLTPPSQGAPRRSRRGSFAARVTILVVDAVLSGRFLIIAEWSVTGVRFAVLSGRRHSCRH